ARTFRARLLAITLAEGSGLVPRGTHRADWFVPPAELDHCANAAGLVRITRCGESVRPLATLRRRAIVLRKSRDFSVGYAVLYRRRSA
ncbi:MAG: bifunctional 2-polyprenyl-6-hydroxyphenol methylase/3-demethylubiquinol 3-O-methyltransferase UbiG, partial [Planctomycetes bacterium]|nr:bifunctional 2-polyprenyl-6-hydroxyphenol methylase/3-demethylubiquinol 3-O-methyltransferase UbiG [Planctomycetota bacterium]